MPDNKPSEACDETKRSELQNIETGSIDNDTYGQETNKEVRPADEYFQDTLICCTHLFLVDAYCRDCNNYFCPVCQLLLDDGFCVHCKMNAHDLL